MNKYFGEPITTDVLLDKQCDSCDVRRITKIDFRILGFAHIQSEMVEQAFPKGVYEARIIDLIQNISRFTSSASNPTLAKFYLDYFNKKIEKENSEVESEKELLVQLKNQLVFLENEKIKLDKKIATLLEQINALEEGEVTNVRK